MNHATLTRTAERLLRDAGARVVRRTNAHVIWTLNGYRYLTPRHKTRYTSGKLFMIRVVQFIRRHRP
jgi:hypothetical protein